MTSRRIILLGVSLMAGPALYAQTQTVYAGSAITGQLQLLRTTNLTQIAGSPALTTGSAASTAAGPENPRFQKRLPPPPPLAAKSGVQTMGSQQLAATSLSVGTAQGNVGFDGMTHADQRLANGGNQFSVEPPNPSIAVAGGKVLEGVNNAVRIFGTSGAPLLPAITSNQLFGLAPAIDRTQTPNIYGVYTTDMRVFFDQDTNRWFVLQRSQDEDIAGTSTNQSHIYLAVSQTADPTGSYNVYIMDTTNAGNYGCPCMDDYPQIGADRYGIYISANEYSIIYPDSPWFNDSVIMAISKADLAAGVTSPAISRFTLPWSSGYESSIQPASTPPGASPFLANGGSEFLVSSYPYGNDAHLALWALSNTASLQTGKPNLLLTQTTVPTLEYYLPPNCAPQRSGPLSLGASLECLDAGYFSDSRVLSASYSGGRLFVTLASSVFDSLHNPVSGGLYVVFSPTIRAGVLGATSPGKQGYLAATSNHILRPSVAVNAQGRGAITFTLTGPDYYPSAAFVSIDAGPAAPSVIQLAAGGAMPEDGFSGYGTFANVARWGDYSTAVTSSDGSIWLVNEYIPNLPRTTLANWGTFISQYIP